MVDEAARTLREAEGLLQQIKAAGPVPSPQLKIHVERTSRRLLLAFQKTAECRFFNVFYTLTKERFEAYALRHIHRYRSGIDPVEVANRLYILLFEKLLAPEGKIPLDYLFPWCYRVLLNMVREEARNAARALPLAGEIAEGLKTPSPLDQLIEEEGKAGRKLLFDRVLDILYSERSGLAERDRRIMRLFYLEGRSMREISAEMELTKSHVGVILMRSRRRIARMLSRKKGRRCSGEEKPGIRGREPDQSDPKGEPSEGGEESSD